MGLVALAGLTMMGTCSGSDRNIPWWGRATALVAVGTGMGLTQSPATATSNARGTEPAARGSHRHPSHVARFVSGTLGSTIFGLILQGDVGGIALGFHNAT